MHTIQISPPVWAEIAKRGKFGETEDDVLRRVFGMPPSLRNELEIARPVRSNHKDNGSHQNTDRVRRSFATKRMSTFVRGQALVVEFQDGARKSFSLSDRADKQALRRVRDQAVSFAKEHGATYGQEMAVKKALTEAGYHLMR